MNDEKMIANLTSSSPYDRAQALTKLMVEKTYPKECIDIVKTLINDNSTVAFGTQVAWVATAFLDLAGEIQYNGDNRVINGLIEANR